MSLPLCPGSIEGSLFFEAPCIAELNFRRIQSFCGRFGQMSQYFVFLPLGILVCRKAKMVDLLRGLGYTLTGCGALLRESKSILIGD
jgi:hypothetical protein